MATHEAQRSSVEEQGIAGKLRAAVLVAVLGALGYVVVAIALHSGPWLNAAAQFALESRMTNPDAEAATAPEASVAIAAPLPEADSQAAYVLEQKLNKATEIEEQPPSF